MKARQALVRILNCINFVFTLYFALSLLVFSLFGVGWWGGGAVNYKH